jgi:flagellar basal body-associated protein FliL
LLDVAPDPAGTGVLLAVVFLVIGIIVLLAGGLVAFLWFRKRSMRGLEMIRPDNLPVESAQPGKPSQP